MSLPSTRRLRRLGQLVFHTSLLGACDPSGPRASRAAPKPKPAASSATLPSVESAVARALQAAPPPSKPEPPKALAESEKPDKPVKSSRFVIDGLNDIGPAAPASAFERGVVLVTRSDELSLCKLEQPPSKSKKPVAGAIEPTPRPPGDFWPVARGPAVSASHAYWVSKNRLVRRPLAGGGLEVLANDVREGTRVAVASSPDVVAYIAMVPGKADPIARLRLHDGRTLDVTPEGAAASSVSLTRVGEDLLVSSIDGRSGMTPVHARRFLGKTGQLEADVVVWVSGATQGMTEITSVATNSGSWLLMAVEKDVSHFGLAALALEPQPKMDPPLRWRTYENGLDRAPAAAAVVCGSPLVIYVRPADARPTSNQELVMSELTLAETATSEQLATARGFADVSLYAVGESAVVSYVADRRTWARIIRCK
ncbi:MAG TPA: hypothetical protein VJN18_13605 [Polyangiaceae bacterium]|nr:hypothetical protein [Polyangiaceae bacterium]